MVAFVTGWVVFLAGAVVAFRVMQTRPVGEPLTWGEAAVAALFTFGMMLLGYAIIPNQWLLWADNELNWRADKILFGPGDIVAKLPFTVTYQVLRDLIAAGLYVVFLGGQVFLWSMWQNRGKTKPAELPVSSYGRPLVKKA